MKDAEDFVGRMVRLKTPEDPGNTALVLSAIKNIPGGVLLRTPLAGVQCWHISELEIVVDAEWDGD